MIWNDSLALLFSSDNEQDFEFNYCACN